MNTQICDLPLVLLAEIFLYVPIPNYVRLSVTCKLFQKVLEDPFIWIHHLRRIYDGDLDFALATYKCTSLKELYRIMTHLPWDIEKSSPLTIFENANRTIYHKKKGQFAVVLGKFGWIEGKHCFEVLVESLDLNPDPKLEWICVGIASNQIAKSPPYWKANNAWTQPTTYDLSSSSQRHDNGNGSFGPNVGDKFRHWEKNDRIRVEVDLDNHFLCIFDAKHHKDDSRFFIGNFKVEKNIKYYPYCLFYVYGDQPTSKVTILTATQKMTMKHPDFL